MDARTPDTDRPALQPLGIGVQSDDPPAVFHRRRHHQRLAGRTGADIGHLHAGPGITEQRRDLGGLVLDLEQTVTEFLRVVGAHTLRHADTQRRQLCEVAGHPASGELVTQLVPVADLQRVEADIGTGLAAHRGKLVIRGFAKRRLGIGKQRLGPFEAHGARHAGIVERASFQPVNERNLVIAQRWRRMLFAAAKQCLDLVRRLALAKAQPGKDQRAAGGFLTKFAKMPAKSCQRPVNAPEQRADGLPVARPGIAARLQPATQRGAGRHRRNLAGRQFGKDFDDSGDAGCWGHARGNSGNNQTRGR